MTLSKITALPQQWDTEPDNVNTVSTAAEIKQKLMDNPEHIVAFLDSLIDIFNSTTAGSSGTENIAARAITGVTGATAYAQILDIKTQLDAAILGAIPDGSLVTAKLADDAVTDPKIGDRTIDDSVAATGDTAELGVLLNNLANMLKSISGETSWDTAPGTTLKAHINESATDAHTPKNVGIDIQATGDLIVGVDANDAGRLALGTALQQLRVKSDGTTLEYFTPETPVQVASGTWSDTSTSIAPGATYTKTIPLGFAAKKGLIRLQGTNLTSSTDIIEITFTNNENDTISVFSKNSAQNVYYKTDSPADLAGGALRNGSGGAANLESVYINGSDLQLLIKNIGAGSQVLGVTRLYWEVEG